MKKFLFITIAFIITIGIFIFFPKVISAQSCPPGCGPCDCGFSTQQVPNVGPRCFNNCTNSQVDGGCCYVAPNPPSCTPSVPGAATLISPTNGALVPSPFVTFTWTNSTTWGNGCPNINYYDLYYRLNDPVDGVGSWILRYETTGTTAPALTGFDWGKRYEWGINKLNGTYAAWSGSRFFTTPQKPVLSSYNTNGDVCGGGFSGSRNGINAANVSNPIEYDIQGQHNSQTNPASNIRFIGFSLLPQSGTYAQNADYVPLSTAIAGAASSRTFTFGYNYPDGLFYQYNGAAWTSTAGNTYNNYWNSAQAQNIIANAGTSQIVGSTSTAQTNFDIEYFDGFENFANTNGAFNVYAIAIFTFSDLQEASNDATASQKYMMKKVGTWGVDTSSPTVNVSNPSVNPDPTFFSVNWQASDSKSGVKDVDGFVAADNVNALIRDLGLGQNIDPLASVPPDTVPITGENALVTVGNLGTHNYQNMQPTIDTDYYFKLFAEDNACNIASNLGSGNVPAPIPAPVDAWMLSVGGYVSADGGYNVQIPTQSIDIPNIYTGTAVLSVQSLISGNLIVPSQDKISSVDSYLTNYNTNGGNDATDPPISSDYSTWFEHLLDRAQRNTTVVNSSEGTLNNNFSGSSNFNVPANQSYVYLINNNVNIPSGAVCDIKGMIFIDGNLTINSGLTNSNSTNGCIFIVSGDVTVTPNGRQSTTTVLDSGLATYDTIEAFIVTDGNFNTVAETIPPSNQTDEYDGLLVKGGVYAANVGLNNNINAGGNQNQPAHIFQFDPRYREFLRNYLSSRFFSIRQSQ